jgi:formate hydrogenlyase subunit 3/multisubunit Na+/H+ antiporter MnhD subunit
MLGALSLAVTAQQYVYAILFTWLAAILAVFVLAGGRPGETAGALRTLVFSSLAAMLLLILPRYLEPDPAGYVVAAGAGAPDLPDNAAQIAAWLMVGGAAISLMMVPFYGQLVAIGTHATPMALPLMLTAFPVAVLHTLFQLWRAQPALLQDPLFFQVALWMGIATTGVGGLFAIGQRRWGALAGYATLVDWGAGLIALGLGTLAGIELAVRMLVWRALSMLLVGTGWNALFKASGRRGEMERSRGMFLRRPLSVVALLIGLFSLAGYPLTPGAAGRWPLLAGLVSRSQIITTKASMWAWLIGRTPTQPEALWVLLLAGIGVSIGTIAAVPACLGRPQPGATHEGARPPHATRREVLDSVVSAGFALLALWLVGAVLLQPQPWLTLGQELLGGLSLPGN